MTQITELIVPADLVCDNLEPHKRLENVIKLWIVTSQHENEQENYQKLKEQYYHLILMLKKMNEFDINEHNFFGKID